MVPTVLYGLVVGFEKGIECKVDAESWNTDLRGICGNKASLLKSSVGFSFKKSSVGFSLRKSSVGFSLKKSSVGFS